MRNARLGFIMGLLCCVILGGCSGSKKSKVLLKGTVTLDGEPLDGVLVDLFYSDHPEKGAMAGARTDREGKYLVPKVGAGKYRVVIRKASEKLLPGMAMGPDKPAPSFLPPIYSDPWKTQLSVELAEGENQKDFVLTTKK